MDVIIIAIAYYATLIIGVCVLLFATSYLIDKVFSAILTHFKVYDEFVRFVYDRHRKKKDVSTPKINRKEATK